MQPVCSENFCHFPITSCLHDAHMRKDTMQTLHTANHGKMGGAWEQGYSTVMEEVIWVWSIRGDCIPWALLATDSLFNAVYCIVSTFRLVKETNRPALLRCRNVQWDCTIGDYHTTRAEVLKFSRQTILSVEASVCTSACLRSCSELRNLTAVGVLQLGFCVLPPKCISFQKKPISFHLESSNYRQCLELNPNNPVSIWEKVCMTYFTPPTNLTTCHSHITWLGR